MTALGKLLRTTAFKLTLVYLTVFALFAKFLFVWWPRDDYGLEATFPARPGHNRIIKWSTTLIRIAGTMMNRQGNDITSGHTEAGRNVRAIRVVSGFDRDSKRRVMPFRVVHLSVLVVNGFEFLTFAEGDFP